MLKLQKTFITAEEYFAIEEAAEYKSEYYHGEMFAMSGASHNHNVVAGNTFFSLYGSLRNSNCVVYTGDMKVQVDKGFHYTYPDISVVCGNIEFAHRRNDMISNPVLIVEILSESTREYDRDLKFKAYQNISSLKEYILIDQYSYSVEHFFKDDSGRWMSEKYEKPEDTFRIRSVDVELPLNAIYHRIKF